MNALLFSANSLLFTPLPGVCCVLLLHERASVCGDQGCEAGLNGVRFSNTLRGFVVYVFAWSRVGRLNHKKNRKTELDERHYSHSTRGFGSLCMDSDSSIVRSHCLHKIAPTGLSFPVPRAMCPTIASKQSTIRSARHKTGLEKHIFFLSELGDGDEPF